jgi:hypothetical protein
MTQHIKVEIPEGMKVEVAVPEGTKAEQVATSNVLKIRFLPVEDKYPVGSWWISNKYYKNYFPIRIDVIKERSHNGCYIQFIGPDGTTNNFWLDDEYAFQIPPKPDEDKLKSQGYRLTGEVKIPKNGEHFCGCSYPDIFCRDAAINKFSGYRWIVEKISLKGAELFASISVGKVYEINGVKLINCKSSDEKGEYLNIIPFVKFEKYGCIHRCAFLYGNDLGRAIGQDPNEVTEDQISYPKD